MVTTHFGFEDVMVEEKTARVGAVFSAVAPKYNLMNDLMSFGMHRAWKRFAASKSRLHKGGAVLDVAAGSGDMAKLFARKIGADGTLILTDINLEMLREGKKNLTDAGIVKNIHYVLADAENLSVRDDYFDCACIAFGLRNITFKQNALAAMWRAVKPGGNILVLEFSKPVLPLLEKIYDKYSFKIIPQLGRLVAGDEKSYRYLVESIRRHPSQDELQFMLERAGFEDVRVHNLSGGIVALHIGFKF